MRGLITTACLITWYITQHHSLSHHLIHHSTPQPVSSLDTSLNTTDVTIYIIPYNSYISHTRIYEYIFNIYICIYYIWMVYIYDRYICTYIKVQYDVPTPWRPRRALSWQRADPSYWGLVANKTTLPRPMDGITGGFCVILYGGIDWPAINMYIYTHTHTHIYIYMCVCVYYICDSFLIDI